MSFWVLLLVHVFEQEMIPRNSSRQLFRTRLADSGTLVWRQVLLHQCDGIWETSNDYHAAEVSSSRTLSSRNCGGEQTFQVDSCLPALKSYVVLNF